MNCGKCGAILSGNVKFCESCGTQVAVQAPQKHGRIGYSDKINDPAFKKYLKDSNRWSGIFSLILAAAAVGGFYIYGETSSEMENPEALYIGLGIGGMFVVIALFQMLGRKLSKTWDGAVVDKRVSKKQRHQSSGSGENDYYVVYYTEYLVEIRSDKGKTYNLTAEDDSTVYDYYKIGDRVRHHGGLNSYEKYDKSGDIIIFCNACGSLNEMDNDHCFRCNCPLLK